LRGRPVIKAAQSYGPGRESGRARERERERESGRGWQAGRVKINTPASIRDSALIKKGGLFDVAK
jgi:hypothetical protein